jgi:protein-tyrosine phosphatase
MLPGPYLNASLVPGLEPAARAFVASQAPPPHTYAAFFAALVAHDVRLLVNLTALEEHGRTKADAYWPRADGRWHAVAGSEWAVCTAGERRVGGPDAGELTRRVLRLRHGAAGPVHEVVQLHLTSWADHGSSSAAAFRALIAAIDAEAQHGAVADAAAAQPPLWVHCSAGVGRSGTLIGALLARDAPAATRQLADAAPASPSSGGLFAAVMARVQSNDEQLPPPTRAARDIVAHMRQARPCMVQTPAQLGMLVEQVQGVLQPPEPQK